MSLHIEIVGKTDTGICRDINQDSMSFSKQKQLAILCDGMGGAQAGEIASAMAVTMVMEGLTQNINRINTTDINIETGLPLLCSLIETQVQAANTAIFDASKENPQFQGMGTTIVVAMIENDHIHTAHVGDSRLYRLRDMELEQMTEDHSLVHELVKKGFYTPEEAEKADNKNIITRALGTTAAVRVDIHQDIIYEDDLYLLCSDGVSDMISDDEIQQILMMDHNNLQDCVSSIITAANNGGGRDNITAILIRVGKKDVADQGLFNKVSGWLFEK